MKHFSPNKIAVGRRENYGEALPHPYLNVFELPLFSAGTWFFL